jgi:hypothetical protein
MLPGLPFISAIPENGQCKRQLYATPVTRPTPRASQIAKEHNTANTAVIGHCLARLSSAITINHCRQNPNSK